MGLQPVEIALLRPPLAREIETVGGPALDGEHARHATLDRKEGRAHGMADLGQMRGAEPVEKSYRTGTLDLELAAAREIEHAGPVPISLRADDHIGIAVERDGVGARLKVEDHLGIGEIGKSELAVVAERLGAEMRPEVNQPVLRVAIDLLEPLALDVIEAGLHQLERYARPPELTTDGEAFDLGKLAKKPHPKTGRGLIADKADEVRGDQIVAVELFLDRAILLGKVHGGANSGHQHQIVGIAGDAD